MKTNATTPIPQGYKSTPLGTIPQEWEVKRFRDAGNFLRNNTLSRDKMSESDGCVQNIHYGDVLIKYRETLNVSKTNIPWIVEDSKDSPLGDMLQDGDVVISDTAEDYTVGKATELLAINGASIVAGLHTMPFRPLPNLFSPCFLGYYINSMAYRFQLYALIQGIKVCAISKKAMSGTFLITPPLAEQQKIAEILGTWDKAIEKQSQLIEQLTLRKRGLMQQLLTAKRRLPGFSDPWKNVNYCDILKEIRRSLKWDDNELYDLISVRRRSGGVFHRESLYGHEIKTKSLRPALEGDFLISKMQIVHGASGVVPKQLSGMKISGSYIALVAKDSQELNIDYFNLWSQMPLFYHQTFISSYGVHIEKMTFDLEAFMSLAMNLPPIEEQNKIVAIISAACKEIELAQQKLELLRQQKRGLMQQLLTGKKRVKV